GVGSATGVSGYCRTGHGSSQCTDGQATGRLCVLPGGPWASLWAFLCTDGQAMGVSVSLSARRKKKVKITLKSIEHWLFEEREKRVTTRLYSSFMNSWRLN